MATWDEVRGYAKETWPITGETEGFIAIEFKTGEGRTQMTGIRLLEEGTEPRIRLESQFGWEGDLDPAAALRLNAVLPLGAGAVDENDRLLYVYSMMLRTLNPPSLDIAIKTIAVYGDQMEHQHSWEDRF